LWLACALLGGACQETTVVASTCVDQECPELPECRGAIQQYPDLCTKEVGYGTCNDAVFPNDNAVCEGCFELLERLDIESPLGPCACTYCGVQMLGCVASVETGEPDADPIRDRLCQQILECAWANGCEGSACYCGEGVRRETCLKNANEGRLLGPCATLIQNAAECAPGELQGNCVHAEQARWDSVIARATEVALCVSGDAILQADPIVLETEVVPMCK
jgi:hypothetical protein